MKYRHLLAALLLPLALIAAACGDDEGASSASAGSDAAAGRTDTVDAAATEVVAQEGEEPLDPRAVLPMGTPPEGDTAELNIAQIAAGTAAVSNLTQLVVKAGLVPTLRDGGPFTVFAPVNEAFDALPFATYISVVEDNATLTTVLTLHVVPGTYTAADLMDLDGESLETVQGGRLLVEVDGDDVVVGGATVVVPDIEASNGMIHAVDSVIAEPNG